MPRLEGDEPDTLPSGTLSGKALGLARQPASIINIQGMKPAAAVRKLGEAFQANPSLRTAFLENSRAAAVMGNCPKSRKNFRSGVTLWCSFVKALHGQEEAGWPPRLDDMLAWTHSFTCLGTFCNYEGQVRTAAIALGLPVPAACDPALKRARGAIAKRMLSAPRPKVFLQRSTVFNMLAVDTEMLGMLWVASYVFLLRVPSEALPMAKGGEGVVGQSVLSLVDPTTVELRLGCRKNKPRGERLRRSCSCRDSGRHPMCPVHALWHAFFAKLEPGAQPWAHLAPRAVISHIRGTLTRLQVG
jgi:hypothetical protein